MAIVRIMSLVRVFGIMLSSAIMGVPVYRDIEHKTENYFFSFPVTEKGYLLGRFLGSMFVLFLVSLRLHLGLIIGFTIGPFAGYIEPDRFMDLNLWYYLQPTIIIYWTNLFFAGCLFFALVSLTKKVLLVYAGCAIFFITYLVTLTLTQDIENKDLVSLIDPFGLGTYNNISSIGHQKNKTPKQFHLVEYSFGIVLFGLDWAYLLFPTPYFDSILLHS